MEIIKKVIVKQVLTENSKNELRQKFTLQKELLHKEIEQLQFQLKKYEKNKLRSTQAINEVNKEILNRKEKQKLLSFQLEQLHILPIGSELKEMEVEAIVEMNIGDNWDELTKGRTIVIKDGIVHDIR